MSTTNGWNNQVAAAKSDVTLNAGTNTINISTDAAANAVNVGTGAAAKTVIVGSTNGASASTLQSGSGALNVTATNGALTINSGTGNLGISTDASATTVNIATGAAAKVTTLGSTNGASSLALKYGTADFSLASATGNVIVALDTGEVTKPLQSAFGAYVSATINDITGDTTTYHIIFDTEVFDRNSDYNNATGTFTAPVGGIYYFSAIVNIQNVAVAHNSASIQFVTTSKTFPSLFSINPGAAKTSFNTLNLNCSAAIQMSAGDTFYTSVRVDGSTKTIDVTGDASGIYSYLSGYLVC